jgi:hypothetical protein
VSSTKTLSVSSILVACPAGKAVQIKTQIAAAIITSFKVNPPIDGKP